MNDTKQHDDGGPAFPVAGHTGENPELTAYGKLGHPGMSLRDWFAGMALQGLLSNSGGPIQANGMSGWGWVNCGKKDVADVVWEIADAMIAARKEAP